MSSSESAFDLVAIGASAGGFNALTSLLPSLRPGFPAAVVVVLHLPPERPSGAGEALGRTCALPVREAFDKEPIEPGNVYLAPPDYHLLIEPERVFSLSIDEPVHFSRPSIDVMLESAAYAYRDRMVGAILTGASADGAAGLERVRALGGTTWVQSPETAAVATMPRAAIDRARPDRILTLEEMAEGLERLCHGNRAR
jgi:two-component system chemotaxis response regulator CheB